MNKAAITSEAKTHIMIFQDESMVFISQEERDRLLEILSDPEVDHFKIGQSIYRLAQVAKILDMAEFYREYPQKRTPPEPAKFMVNDPAPIAAFDPLRAAGRSKRAIDSLVRGYERGRIEVIGEEAWEKRKAGDGLFQKMIARQKEMA